MPRNEWSVSKMILGTKAFPSLGHRQGPAATALLLSGASEWAGRIKSREPFGGTVSNLCWSLEVKDGGWNGQNSEGRGLHWSAVGSCGFKVQQDGLVD